MRVRNNYKTNGGAMIDLNVTFEDKETNHRVIVGREYYEDFGLTPEDVLALTFAFLLRKKVPRQTEGAPPPSYPYSRGLPFRMYRPVGTCHGMHCLVGGCMSEASPQHIWAMAYLPCMRCM